MQALVCVSVGAIYAQYSLGFCPEDHVILLESIFCNAFRAEKFAKITVWRSLTRLSGLDLGVVMLHSPHRHPQAKSGV